MDTWPLVGRGPQRDLIAQTIPERAVVIRAGPGCGKTRLARVALDQLTDHRVIWIVGSRAGASIPFGAVADLVPDHSPAAGSRLGLLREILAQVHRWGRVALGVDDAHLLDEASAAVVAHLIRGGRVRAVLTVRTGQSTPDAIVALWKDGYAAVCELPPLPAAAVDELLDGALPGGLDGLSRRRLHDAAAGNPQALRNVVQAGLFQGVLRQRYGLWRLRGGIPSLSGAGDSIVPPGLDPHVRTVAQVVAIAEPVPLRLLERVSSLESIAAAEGCGLIAVERVGLRVQARRGDPLYGEALRGSATVSQSRLILRRLAAGLMAGPMRRRDDALRAAQWQVDGGEITRPDIVFQGAWQAIGQANVSLAERLARAARAAAPGVEANRLLARILWYCGRNGEAVAAGVAAAGFLDQADAVDVISAQGEAVSVQVRDTLPWGAFAVAVGRCLAAMASGDLSTAHTLADNGYSAAVDSGVPMMVCGWALCGGLVALMRGHLDRADILLREAAAGFEENDTLHLLRCCVSGLAAVAALRGDPDQAAQWSDRLAIRDDHRVFAPWAELWRAWVARAGGRPDDATEHVASAARLARSMSMSTVEATAHYTALRMGGVADLSRLNELASASPFAAALAGAAHALSMSDPAGLAAAATVFEQHGQDLLAAEAMTVAAAIYREQGHRGPAGLTQASAAALRARSVNARTPLLANDHGSARLTPREREVAMLAVCLSSRQIAARLGLAVATVNNNLARAYAKLGISGRGQLRQLLQTSG